MKHAFRKGTLAAAVIIGIFGAATAQAQSFKPAPGNAARSADAIPAVRDWSSRAVIHHNPKTPDEFEQAGRSADLRKSYADPRYVASLMRRIEAESPALPQALAAGNARNGGVATARSHRRGPTKPKPQDGGTGSVQRDWSNVLGGGTNGLGGSGIAGVFPAKYNFDITAAPAAPTISWCIQPMRRGRIRRVRSRPAPLPSPPVRRRTAPSPSAWRVHRARSC